mmetsp:Transcript_12730/g.35991  ORF Transcript_12730/g.35991 Transcript_12730/m.35991 type:complete len:89 (+) Transcript_12730:26-292(+)
MRRKICFVQLRHSSLCILYANIVSQIRWKKQILTLLRYVLWFERAMLYMAFQSVLFERIGGGAPIFGIGLFESEDMTVPIVEEEYELP